jgi:hypothetical protein
MKLKIGPPWNQEIAAWLGNVTARAFDQHQRFGRSKVVFVGDWPYSQTELASLLPPTCEHSIGFVSKGWTPSYVVIGQESGLEGKLDLCMQAAGTSTCFVPQEGFLDELLFGHDWWTDEVEGLNDACENYPGLAYVRSQSAEFQFSWPSTRAEPVPEQRGDDGRLRLEETALFRLGYNVSHLDRNQRWTLLQRILERRQLTLSEVASTIASHCRTRRKQHGGETRYALALGKWEDDLRHLKEKYYKGPTYAFTWPSTGR